MAALTKTIIGFIITVSLVLGGALIEWEFDKDYVTIYRDNVSVGKEKWVVEAERTYFNLDSWYDINVKCPKVLELGGHTTATRCYYPDDYYQQLSRSLIRTKIYSTDHNTNFSVFKKSPNYAYGTRGSYAGYVTEEMIFLNETLTEEEFPIKYYVSWEPRDTRNYRLIWRVEDLRGVTIPAGNYTKCAYRSADMNIDLKEDCSKLDYAEVKEGGKTIWFHFLPMKGDQMFDLKFVDPITYTDCATDTGTSGSAMGWTHTISCASSDVMLIVAVAIDKNGDPGDVAGIDVDGDAMTVLDSIDTVDGETNGDFWYLANPSCGTDIPIDITWAGGLGADGVAAVSCIYTGIKAVTVGSKQVDREEGGGNPGTMTTSVTAGATDLVIEMMALDTDPGADVTVSGDNANKRAFVDQGTVSACIGDAWNTGGTVVAGWGGWTKDEAVMISVAMTAATPVTWNTTSYNFGELNKAAGNVSIFVNITAEGPQTSVVVSCSGDCVEITSNWTTQNMDDGQTALVNITCDVDNSAVGTYQADFEVVSNEDASADTLTVDCEIIAYGTLNVTIIEPDDNSDYITNDLIHLNASISCSGVTGAQCGTVYAYARNTTAPGEPGDKDLISIEIGDLPFYLLGGGFGKTIYNFSDIENPSLTSNATGAIDQTAGEICINANGNFPWCSPDIELSTINYGEISQSDNNYLELTSDGDRNSELALHFAISEDEAEITMLNFTLEAYDDMDSNIALFYFDHTVEGPSKNWTSVRAGGCETGTTDTGIVCNITIFDKEKIQALVYKGYVHYHTNSYWFSGSHTLFIDNVKLEVGYDSATNQLYSPTLLTQGDTWSPNWTIDVSSITDESFDLDVKFNSSLGNANVPENNTLNRQVNLNPSANEVVWGSATYDFGTISTAGPSEETEISIDTAGAHTNVAVSCSGDCAIIVHNWTTQNMGDGISRQVNITCIALGETPGSYQSVFEVTSDEDASADTLTVDCEVIAADTCTYTSGDWVVDCSDNCLISSVVNMDALSTLFITGTGSFITTEDITGYDDVIIHGTDSSNKCIVKCSGGCFK